MDNNILLELNELKTHFNTERGQVTAVNGIDLQLKKGEILGIVGESGCGKSVMSQSILRLLDEKYTAKYEGEILFEEENLLDLPLSKMEKIRGNDISMIFQDPLSSLDPVYTVGYQIAEAIMIHQKVQKKVAYKRAVELLKLTGIPAPERRVNEYPHELSGGMRQRAMIAMALACQPKLLIADEPTTALDVTIQAQILELILKLNEELGMSVIFITHDLGVVAEVCSRVAVMYLGQIVEEADVETLFTNPTHPYTKGLIESIPRMDGDRSKDLHIIKGTVPSLNEVPKGCRFASRCKYASEQCIEEMPVLENIQSNHKVRCWHHEKITNEEAYSHAGTSI